MTKKLMLNIELSNNGICLVEKLVKTGNVLSKPEIEKYSFRTTEELSAWIAKQLEE